MDKGKQLSINLITQIISFGLNLAISFFLTPYVIQYIGKEVYGFVSLANNFTSYISVFTVALNGMLGRYITIAYSKRDYETASKYLTSVFIANIAVMLILTPIAILFIINLNIFINLPSGFEVDIKILFALVFGAFLVNLPGCCFSTVTFVKNRLDKSNVANVWGNIIRIAVTIILLIRLFPHVWYVGMGMLVSTLFLIARNIDYKRTLLPEVKISKRYFEWSLVKELLNVGVWNSVNQLTGLLMTGLDLIIANLFISVLSMNLLSYAKMIPIQIVSFISMIAGLFAPQMTIAYASNDMNRFTQETNYAIKLCGFLCSVPTIGLVVFGDKFFYLWLSALSAEEVHTVAILSILTILPQIVSVYIYPLYSVNTITTKLRIPVMVSLALGIVNIISVLILVQITTWEIYVVAGVSSIIALARILIFVPIYAAYNIKVPYGTFYKPLAKGILSSLIMLLVFIGIKALFVINNWISFMCVCIFAGMIGYIISFLVVFNKDEKRKIIYFLKARIKRT